MDGGGPRFYESNGWREAGPIDHAAEIAGGTIPAPSRQYQKRVRGNVEPRAGGALRG